MTPRTQGYLYVLITMVIWGGFTLTSRLNVKWGIEAWDITALRFALAFVILVPILIYKKDLAFLWKKEPFILAMIGGVGYCLTAYTAFHYVPAAHAAIFLNESKEFKALTNDEIVEYMKRPVVFDFKGVLNPYALPGVEYYAIGKRSKKKQ